MVPPAPLNSQDEAFDFTPAYCHCKGHRTTSYKAQSWRTLLEDGSFSRVLGCRQLQCGGGGGQTSSALLPDSFWRWASTWMLAPLMGQLPQPRQVPTVNVCRRKRPAMNQYEPPGPGFHICYFLCGAFYSWRVGPGQSARGLCIDVGVPMLLQSEEI